MLDHTVRDELTIALSIQGIEMADVVLASIADSVISRLDYGFRFRWDPQ